MKCFYFTFIHLFYLIASCLYGDNANRLVVCLENNFDEEVYFRFYSELDRFSVYIDDGVLFRVSVQVNDHFKKVNILLANRGESCEIINENDDFIYNLLIDKHSGDTFNLDEFIADLIVLKSTHNAVLNNFEDIWYYLSASPTRWIGDGMDEIIIEKLKNLNVPYSVNDKEGNKIILAFNVFTDVGSVERWSLNYTINPLRINDLTIEELLPRGSFQFPIP